MKVVDMFGAGLPVLGWSAFESWPELVQEGINGKGFENVEELVTSLVGLFGEDKNAHQDRDEEKAVQLGKLESLKEGAMKEGERRWEEEWEGKMRRVFNL